MIAVDSSALIAVVAQEAEAVACSDALLDEDDLIISAATLAEALIVAKRKGVEDGLRALLDGLALDVVEVDAGFAEAAAAAYERWGKGFHPADLNYGDSFSYALAEMYDCPLLFIGKDFPQTDIRSALLERQR